MSDLSNSQKIMLDGAIIINFDGNAIFIDIRKNAYDNFLDVGAELLHGVWMPFSSTNDDLAPPNFRRKTKISATKHLLEQALKMADKIEENYE